MRRGPALLATLPALVIACAGEEPPVVMPPPTAPPPSASSAVETGPPPARRTPDAPFRAAPPPPGPPVTFVAPVIEEVTLKNGLRVLLVERHDLPIVAVRVLTTFGAGDLPGAPPGAASMMGSMLELGTASRSALQISDAYEALGGTHGSWVDWDSGGAGFKVTRDKLDAALGVLADVVLHPTFPVDEIERVRGRRLGGLQEEQSSPPAMAENATAAALFGRAHPYGHSIWGDATSVKSLQRADLERAYAALFVPKACAVLVAGDVTRDAIAPKLDAAFGAWVPPHADPLIRVRVPEAPRGVVDAPRLVVVDHPRTSQSVVRLAELGIAANAPDRDATVVMNTIFGGMFSSRINLNLREVHAYTYGASSRFDWRHGRGPFVATASVKESATASAIAELFKEERSLVTDLVSPDELAAAKASLELALPAHFETVDSITMALTDLAVYHLPKDEYATLPARIGRVTAEDVRKAARAHLHPRTLRVVVVGDRSRLEAALEPLHLGRVEARDAYGDLIPHLTPP
jgi:predicted Zn-dependent peptidase